jgi:ribonuclease HI
VGALKDQSRSYEAISVDDLGQLAAIARQDRAARFERRPRWKPYADRVLCVALCQGAALHYVDGCNGVKDLDVYTFYAEHPTGPFPYRWRTEADFGPSKFGRYPGDPASFRGRRVDLIGSSLDVAPDTDPVESVRRYLAEPRTETARQLAKKAVVLLDPEPRRGQVVWPLAGTVIWTDGSCNAKGAAGRGGWAALIERDGTTEPLVGSAMETTQNRMELTAVCEALERVTGVIEVRTDSTYIEKCFNEGRHIRWRLDDKWRTTKGPVLNRDLWERLFALVEDDVRHVLFVWVKGHATEANNNVVDRLSREASQSHAKN